MSHPESVGTGSDSSESVNGSWVQLDESVKVTRSVTTSPKFSDEDEVKDLLADAVEDHFKNQKSLVVTSKEEEMPACKPLHSPNEKPITSAEWVMNWSSRPEVAPKKKWISRQASSQRKGKLSLRRTKVMKSGVEFFKINLSILIPALVLSHSIIFGIGIYVGHHLVKQRSD